MPGDPTVVLGFQQRILRRRVLVPGLAENQFFPGRDFGADATQLFGVSPAAYLVLAGIGMHVVDADLRAEVLRAPGHPSRRVVLRRRVLVTHHHVGRRKRHLSFQVRIPGHFGVETLRHRAPQVVIAVGRGPVAVGFVEDDEMADAVEPEVADQKIQVIDRHLHPLLRILHRPRRRIVFTVGHRDAVVLTILQQAAERREVAHAVVTARRGIVIAVGAVDHAAHITRAHEIEAFGELRPIGVAHLRAPRFGFVVRVPLDAVADVIRTDDPVGHFDPEGLPRIAGGEQYGRGKRGCQKSFHNQSFCSVSKIIDSPGISYSAPERKSIRRPVASGNSVWSPSVRISPSP